MNKNVLALAYLGDSIYEVYIRKYLIDQGIEKVNTLQKEATNYVSAKSQCKYLTQFIEKTLYKISITGFATPQKEFIRISDNTIDFSGDSFRVDTKKEEKEIDRILLSKDGISCFTILDEDFSSQKSYLSFSKDKISLKTITSREEVDTVVDTVTGELSIEDNKITSNGNFFAQRNILFGNSLEYRKAIQGKIEVGYDLYIKTPIEASVSGQ